ncbi:MAG: lipoyl domain-containing protein, partial [Alphaproteobacteria bacterium]|nr:lipoyl domain-containing protein [Alphaproteobacteria bacterium]
AVAKAAQVQEVAVDGEPVKMPFGDLTVSEGKLIRWVAAEGAKVEQGALVAEVETDKAVVEIEAPVAGIVAKHLFPEGTVVKMGATLTSIRSK